ncbi:hypothetical protein AAG570_006500 [Ranatra chinensis]|uniref:Uncharacterized protein n=1 Tax=Ranatra chinensis TaxID=642074 RepID=A0ABD0YU93_9HEMI
MPLDAHTLLASRAVQKRKISCSSTTPPSSLDLEWENEGALASTSFHRKRLPSCNLEEGSSESGVGGTSPESLEWDPCDQSGTDIETEQLIYEIERLTSRALNETGDWTNR